jgi:hypothetical protein
MGYLNIYNINKFILVFDLKYKKNTFFKKNFPSLTRVHSNGLRNFFKKKKNIYFFHALHVCIRI